MGQKRSRSRYVVVAALAVAALTAVSADPAHGAVSDNKTYTVDIDGSTAGAAPAAWAGDVNATIAVVITNTGPSQSLGSANVTVPAPFTLVSAPADTAPGGPVVELRNLGLAPGKSVTVALTVDVRTCSSATGTFAVSAKQSNDYNGTGNDFFLAATADRAVEVTSPCRLAFLDQPADAERNATITSVDYSPAGVPVSVEVRDAGGSGRIGASTPLPAAIVLGMTPNPGALVGTAPTSVVAGVAKFAPKVAVSAFGYSLTATMGSATAPASNPFDIVDDQVNCPAGGACAQTASAAKNGQTVTATFGAGPSATNLLVSLGAADAPAFACADYPRPAGSAVSQFVFTDKGGAARIGTFTVTVPDASRPLNSYEICWAAPYPFQTDSGAQPSIGAFKPVTRDPLYVGTLPDCPKKGTLLPCVASRTFKKATSTTPASVIISVTTDGRDPWAY